MPLRLYLASGATSTIIVVGVPALIGTLLPKITVDLVAVPEC